MVKVLVSCCGQPRSQRAAIDMDLAHQVAGGIELGGDARAEIDGVADQAFVAGLEGGHERFAGVALRHRRR